ncbi:DNA (cytosine-5-)-methyltransferase [Polynucleobacter sp. AP-Sving-400A-A2]|uniref:DNA (cytosine-5-)-methyltransferase n=1 Tax=Polynucleobacter sp. AP-Sving-400A-A2 TaxID=2081049 RepID=UPI001BFEBC39|nr:DNA (cytosine-5-)-methyltransferase [Polynucleobacter sp. AP-Sving-400A-A2]
MKNLKFIDLFAGIGGMRIAFESAGAECVLTCEINEDALTTYKANFKSNTNHTYHNDILTLTKEIVPAHNILVAGFPCQPYSIAGLRKGLKDERGGDVFLSILKILKEKKPDTLLLENVKGMLNHDKGETFAFMLKSLADCGYVLTHKVLNSMEYANVPQNRERVFVVGFRDVAKLQKFTFPTEVELTKTIHDCLETEQVAKEFYYDNRYDCFAEIQKSIKSRDTIYQWRRQYVRENKSNACPTLTANMGTGGHNVPLVKDDFGIRKLTPRETANFQGFPKTYKLPKLANSKLYHQFGNSVTVPLITKIAKQIVKVL